MWDPFPSLPKCVITHCVHPPDLPPEFNMQEDTSEWTSVGETKNYHCIGDQVERYRFTIEKMIIRCQILGDRSI